MMVLPARRVGIFSHAHFTFVDFSLENHTFSLVGPRPIGSIGQSGMRSTRFNMQVFDTSEYKSPEMPNISTVLPLLEFIP